MADRITPAVMARPRPTTGRRQVLLAAIRSHPGVWTTSRARALYRASWPIHVYRSNVRGDLCELRTLGYLTRHQGEDGRTFYLYVAKGPSE